MKTLDATFEKMLYRYIRSIERDLKKRLQKAKDKEFVLKEIQIEIELVKSCLFHGEKRKLLAKRFTTYYKRGENIEDIVREIRKEFDENVDVQVFKTNEDGSEEELFAADRKEEEELKEFTRNQRKMVRYFIRILAYDEIFKRLPEYLHKWSATDETGKKPTIALCEVKWTGTKEENKNEFVQLVYGLHKAGFINNGKGEITKIVESLSEVFGIELGKNWQSNHSSSIHKSKHNYQPPIFDAIKKAYADYAEELRKEKFLRKK